MTNTTATCPELEALEREIALYAESTHRSILKQLSEYAEQAEEEQAEILDTMHTELKEKAFETVWNELEARTEVLDDIRNGFETAQTEQAEAIEKYAHIAEIIKELDNCYEMFAKNAEMMKQIKKKRITVKATAKSRNPERKTIRATAKAKHIEAPAQPKPAEPEHITENQGFTAKIKGFFRKVQKIAASITF